MSHALALIVIESMESGNIHRGIYDGLVNLGLPCLPLVLPRNSSAVDSENAVIVAAFCQRDDVGMVILVGPNDHLAESALAPAKRLKKPIVSIQLDDPWGLTHKAVRLTAFYDEVLTNDPGSCGQYKKMGARYTAELPFGVDPAIFKAPSQPMKVIWPLLFLGSMFRSRLKNLQALKAAKLPIACLGPGPPPLWEQSRRVPGWMIPHIFAASQVCLNFADQPDGRLGLKIRPFEIAASGGGCLLTEEWPGCRKFFIDGEEAVFFKSLNELVEKARWLLDEPERCRQISQRAYRRAHQHHTWGNRLRQHVERWQANLVNKGELAHAHRNG